MSDDIVTSYLNIYFTSNILNHEKTSTIVIRVYVPK